MNPDLSSKVALVTGASRGIGKAIALGLARCGAHVVLLARDEKRLAALADEIAAAGGAATPLVCDLGDEAQLIKGFENIQDQQGRLDILINNAGVGRFSEIQDIKTDDLEQMYRINVQGSFICAREAMKRMQPRRSGYIINISSVVGFKGYPKQSGYTATKHAMMGMTKSLAVEAQEHGIRVSVILPGGVDTEMVAQARPDLDRSNLMRPEDIAECVQYLLSLSDHCAIDQIYIRRRNSAPF